MSVADIYATYRIMPGLQMHQLRVAAVGKLIAGHFDGPLDTDSIVRACLFHDMGNILKSDLDLMPELLGDEGQAHWEEVKRDFARKYGPNEHDATLFIAAKIGLPDAVLNLISGVGFANLEEIRDRDLWEMKIVEYADLRVGPHGILPLRERIEEAGKRYAGRYPDMPVDSELLGRLVAAADAVERQISERCSIAPAEITDAAVAPLVQQLREREAA